MPKARRKRNRIAALIGGILCGDQAARPCRRLDHHHSARKAGYDAVALREMPGLRLAAGGLL